ncbi:hypothetical protein NUW54_g12358 [Trametes sanguinea]|uniref:Uncharacterized protein n=1 Tax=Trametes sanguinea TaxID=158606 RepID=A0ACC1MZH8_9APHY|nr:hypothetical protein NUW54_g12358 [Trametes sanguinea]
MSTFHMDGTDIQILDMRSPGQPVMELKAHRAQVNALGWSSTDSQLLATAGDDCQLLLWDLAPHTQAAAASPRTASTGLSSPRPDVKKRVITDPVMAYTGAAEITNLAWSPQIASMAMNTGHTTAPGEWIAVAMGKSIKALKV